VLAVGTDLPVRAAFDTSYGALPPAAAQLYRLLSLIPGPDFSAGLGAATAGLPPGRSAALLDELATASLLAPPL
jgi:hypothetical protein